MTLSLTCLHEIAEKIKENLLIEKALLVSYEIVVRPRLVSGLESEVYSKAFLGSAFRVLFNVLRLEFFSKQIP